VTDSLEAALQRIEDIRLEEPTPQRAGAVEYSIVGDALEEVRARLEELFARLWRMVASYADVRTPAACTQMAWGGNVSSSVSVWAGAEGLRAHREVVAKDIVRRAQWIRILIASAAVAVTVSAASANPVAIPSAIGAGRKLVRELEAVLGA